MQRSFLLVFLFISLCISSCGFKDKHDAQDFYNSITGINDSLNRMTTEWNDMLDKAIVHKNYSSLTTCRTTLGAFISESRSTVANMETASYNEKIKNNMEALLSTQSAKVAEVYPAFELYSALTPKITLDNSITQLGDDLNSEKMASESIKKSLAALASKYGLKK